MKFHSLFASLLVLGAAFVACGPAEEEDDPTPVERCEESCENAAECSMSVGSSGQSPAACKRNCEETVANVRERGCLGEYENLLKCANANYSCTPTYASGESPCERQTERFVDCYLAATGSGS